MLQGLAPLYLGLLSSEEVGVASTYHRQDMLQGNKPLYLGLLSSEVEEGTASTKGRMCCRDYSLCTWACCPVRWRREQPLPQAGYATGTTASVPGFVVLSGGGSGLYLPQAGYAAGIPASVPGFAVL
jgi:hypothetical protein